MQYFATVFLIAVTLQIIKGELKFCGNEKQECNTNEIMFSDSENNDLNTLVRHAIEYFSDLNQKYDKKINTISSDIGNIKKSLQMESMHQLNCLQNPQEASHTLDNTETTTQTPSSLYDTLWVIILRRQDGFVNFYRRWHHYKQGFGNPFREFFIGLDKIHFLTNSGIHELLIQLEDFKGNLKYALYDEFLVGNESEKYRLIKLGNYSGNAGDYMRNHEGMYFSTKDRDNDANENLNCAIRFQGGWWYNSCLTSNLCGPFRTRHVVSNVGITWGKFDEMQIKTVQMMIRLKR